MVTSRTPVSKKTSSSKKVAATTATTKKAVAGTAKAAPKARAKKPAASVPKPAPSKLENLTLDLAATSKPKTTSKAPAKKSVSPEERYKMIAAAAYFMSERHGFSSGRALDDWIAAEKEIDAMLKS